MPRGFSTGSGPSSLKEAICRIERSVHLVLRLAGGDADALSGRYITVEDDLDALVKQFGAPADQSLLRVNGIAALSVG